MVCAWVYKSVVSPTHGPSVDSLGLPFSNRETTDPDGPVFRCLHRICFLEIKSIMTSDLQGLVLGRPEPKTAPTRRTESLSTTQEGTGKETRENLFLTSSQEPQGRVFL